MIICYIFYAMYTYSSFSLKHLTSELFSEIFLDILLFGITQYIAHLAVCRREREKENIFKVIYFNSLEYLCQKISSIL